MVIQAGGLAGIRVKIRPRQASRFPVLFPIGIQPDFPDLSFSWADLEFCSPLEQIKLTVVGPKSLGLTMMKIPVISQRSLCAA